MENTIRNTNFCSNNNSKKRRKLSVLLSRIYSSRKALNQTSGISVRFSWWVRQHWNLPFPSNLLRFSLVKINPPMSRHHKHFHATLTSRDIVVGIATHYAVDGS